MTKKDRLIRLTKVQRLKYIFKKLLGDIVQEKPKWNIANSIKVNINKNTVLVMYINDLTNKIGFNIRHEYLEHKFYKITKEETEDLYLKLTPEEQQLLYPQTYSKIQHIRSKIIKLQKEGNSE